MRKLVALLLFASLTLVGLGCRSSLAMVQKAMEPYSVEASVSVTDATGAKAVKGVWFNSRFVAVDVSQIETNVVLRGPQVYGGPVVVLYEWRPASTGATRQVWELVIPTQPDERIRLVAATWEQARISMPHMPP